ncbi:hypothetical protein ACJRO7_013557 [Eucalyptus globulus]|uniref:TIR domain-containing protein n=1 Tax=Eucalyptus globulus TaxID=34317 RepID=A0ABD3KY25_EUCGL
MGNHFSKQQLKRVRDSDASSLTISKKQRQEKLVELQSEQCESESPLLLPSSDSSEKIDVLLASGANSDPSTSSTCVYGNNYHVFLSFRGPDTRKGFVSHLYRQLVRVGLYRPNFVFRDDENLCFGEPIAENLLNAIERSKVSIPIISENYAASEWCLRELIHIMECKESGGQIVLPVLYKVKPKDVKHMLGKFGEVFKSGMHRFKEDVKQQGPEALGKALTLRVYESEVFASGHEGELVEELVRVIMGKRQHDFQPHLPVNLVGIDHQVAEVMKLVDIACPETRIIGIWGMGGIGKTTLATIIYNKIFNKFECRSFLKDIRETITRKGVEHVQSRLISDILKIHDHQVYDPNIGINAIQSSCTQKKVLILLDDVDHPNQLDNLIGGCQFSLGSRIIFTSRHKAINCQDKAPLESTYWYELRKMNIENSLLLFSIHAFEKKPPPKQLATLSRNIVAIIGGLPLALTVIGSRLKGEEDQGIWGDMLEKLRNTPDETVQQQLRISYDLLEHAGKQMFLDIACFFIGIDKRIATYIWDCKLYPRIILKELINRSLIYVDDYNELRMHDELRGLGRAIARPADKKLWDCSRLWDEEAMIVLRRKEENENIEALRLDKKGSKEFMERESLKKMPNLKFLHVRDVDFDGDFKGSLSELRWLKWEGCPHSFEATNFHLEKLIVLDLSGSENCISENWRGWSSIKMERLKVLNLSGCPYLRSTPNLSTFKNLEMLILKECAYLEEIDPSIGDVKRLISLNLSHCKSLKKLPEQLGELENLEELVINKTSIKGIPPCIGSLKQLKRLSAVSCLELAEVPTSITSGFSLSLGDYDKWPLIPSSIGKLGELVELDLSRSGITGLPESIGQLNQLKILRISCSRIKRLPRSIGKLQSLQEFDAHGCTSLEGEIHVDKGGLSSLKTLRLEGTKISRLPQNLYQLSSLEHLELIVCGGLESFPKPPFSLSSLGLSCRSNELPSLSHLKHLQELTLHDCESLQSIPKLPSCIRKLDVFECPKLERLPNLSGLEFLSELRLEECNGPEKLDGLEALKSLRVLVLSRVELNLYGFDAEVDNLHAIAGLEKLGSLVMVDISGRKHIQVLDLSKSEHLKQLDVRNCKTLVEIRCPSKFLELFDRRGCESLKIFPDILPYDGLS